jgi:hypothetical protein
MIVRMTKLLSRRVLLAAVVLVLLCYAAILKHYSAQGWGQFVAASSDEGTAELTAKRDFLSQTTSDEQRYRALFGYFLAGAVRFTDAAGSHIHYPGAPSNNGYKVAGLESFARTGTLLAAWLASGRDPVFIDAAVGAPIDLAAYLRRGLLAGTDPKSTGYWGRIRNGDPRTVEAADIARILWMTRVQIWQQFDPQQRAQIATWLRQVDGKKTPGTVWLLFPLTVDMVLRSLGADVGSVAADLPSISNYWRFKQNYLGNGWFSDPPQGADFYNTWGMSYELLWITLVEPQFDRDFIRSSLLQSAEITAHLIGTHGIPLMGRSMCYRTAVPVPLLAEEMLDDQSVSPGLARRGLDVVWRYFIEHGALQDGALTQGYFRNDLRFVDYYTGPGSCHWGLRSLVLAFLQPPQSAFWQAPQEPLPVERADYRLAYDKVGWIVSGRRDDGSVTIEIPGNDGKAPRTLPYARWRKWLEAVFRRPFRPSNEEVEYDRPLYSSAAPLAED